LASDDGREKKKDRELSLKKKIQGNLCQGKAQVQVWMEISDSHTGKRGARAVTVRSRSTRNKGGGGRFDLQKLRERRPASAIRPVKTGKLMKVVKDCWSREGREKRNRTGGKKWRRHANFREA